MKSSNIAVLVALLNGDPSVTTKQSQHVQAILEGKPVPVTPIFVKQSELATLLNTTRQTIRRMTLRGDLKPVKIGGLTRYLVSDVLEQAAAK